MELEFSVPAPGRPVWLSRRLRAKRQHYGLPGAGKRGRNEYSFAEWGAAACLAVGFGTWMWEVWKAKQVIHGAGGYRSNQYGPKCWWNEKLWGRRHLEKRPYRKDCLYYYQALSSQPHAKKAMKEAFPNPGSCCKRVHLDLPVHEPYQSRHFV